VTKRRGRWEICGSALFWALLLASCAAHEPPKAESSVVFVDPGLKSPTSQQPDRVVAGMSRPEVEALMGPTQETCWSYQEGIVTRRVCFREGKVSVISRLEDRPENNAAKIDAVFATQAAVTESASIDGLAIGMSPEKVSQLLGAPKSVIDEYYDGSIIYRAMFVDGKLREFRRIPPPRSY
jgi:outer membrane protein assembly factor BamE (lipoprotein component of BamABCDE complex)